MSSMFSASKDTSPIDITRLYVLTPLRFLIDALLGTASSSATLGDSYKLHMNFHESRTLGLQSYWYSSSQDGPLFQKCFLARWYCLLGGT